MFRLILITATLALAACQDSAPTPEAPQPHPQTKADCAAQGGRWARGGLAGWEMCFLALPDAGNACAGSSDCQGLCLAETRQCSAETPMFGCIPILENGGQKMTICID